LRSPVNYYGGKSYMVKHLLPLIPNHQHYVEAYCGGAWLFFAKSPSLIETLNDLNDGVTTFYRVLRNDPSELMRLLEFTPYARRTYLECREQWVGETDPVKKAWSWFVTQRMAFSGNINSSGWCHSKTSSRSHEAMAVRQFNSAISLIPQAHTRLKSAQIECKSALDVIRAYDHPDVFFYLDPPYVLSARRTKEGYHHEVNDEHHRDLVKTLLSIQGKALLSGYRHAIYEPLERAGWRTLDFDLVSFAHKRLGSGACDDTSKHRTETVWINYDPPVNVELFGNRSLA